MLYFKSPTDFGFNAAEFMEYPAIKTALNDVSGGYDMPLLDPRSVPAISENVVNFFNSDITIFRIFHYPAYYATNVHIDGTATHPVQWAINFPIFGTTNSTMEWAKIKSGSKSSSVYAKTNSSKSVHYEDSDIESYYSDKLELDTVYIVNTNIPHRAVNFKNTPRAILSIRVRLSYTTTIDQIFKKLTNK